MSHPNSLANLGPHKLPDEDVDRIRALVESGLTAGKVAAIIGKTRNAVIGLCSRRGISLTRHKQSTIFTPTAVEELRALAAAGWTREDLAVKFGSGKTSITRVCAAKGIVFRNMRGKIVAAENRGRPIKAPPNPEKPAIARLVEPAQPHIRGVLSLAQRDAIAVTRAEAQRRRDEIRAANAVPTASARPATDPAGCRWPLWSADTQLHDKLVCGASRTGGSYCDAHAILAYRAPDNRLAA